MPPAKHPHHIALRIYDLLQSDRIGPNLLGIVDLFYGDQERISQTPTVTVEAGATESPLAGIPNMVQRQHSCLVTVFHARYDDNSATKLEAEQYAGAIADYLDANLQLTDYVGDDPLVIHGWVVRNAPGFTRVGDNKFRASQLTWQGISKTRLGA